jgi:hypothetical protein
MAISFVNGFLCTSPCDVAKARKGEDPHPSTHAGRFDGRQKPEGPGGLKREDQPAVLFGGTLAGIAADRVQGIDRSQSTELSAEWFAGRIVDQLA